MNGVGGGAGGGGGGKRRGGEVIAIKGEEPYIPLSR